MSHAHAGIITMAQPNPISFKLISADYDAVQSRLPENCRADQCPSIRADVDNAYFFLQSISQIELQLAPAWSAGLL